VNTGPTCCQRDGHGSDFLTLYPILPYPTHQKLAYVLESIPIYFHTNVQFTASAFSTNFATNNNHVHLITKWSKTPDTVITFAFMKSHFWNIEQLTQLFRLIEIEQFCDPTRHDPQMDSTHVQHCIDIKGEHDKPYQNTNYRSIFQISSSPIL